MDDTTMQRLQMVRDPAEKAAILADSFFEGLPKEVAIVARYCVLLHWFDQNIVEALLGETTLSKSQIEKIYEQLVALSFVERLPWGQKFQDLTREGLLARYIRTDQEILKKAAHLAAPAYESRKENKKIVAEALFCYIIAGDQHKCRNLLNVLQEEAADNADWHYLGNLLRLQEEAEKFPFVRPLPRGEQDWMSRGAVHQFQKRMMDALADYDKVLTKNPKNAFAYANRGTIYAEQEQYEKAISDYNHAIQLDPTLSQVHINRGIIYEKKEQYIAALQDFDTALQQVPQHAFAWRNKGAILRELGRYEEALTAYEEALRLDPQSTDAYIYISWGAIMNSLGRYEEALTAYGEALRLDPQSADAYRGRGTALFGLKHYGQASLAYEEALRLEPYSVDGEQSSERAESIYNQGWDQEQSVAHPGRDNIRNVKISTQNNNFRLKFLPRLKNPRFLSIAISNSHYSREGKQGTIHHRIGEKIAAVAIVAFIIIFSSLLFHFSTSSMVGAGGSRATATAAAQATATVVQENPLPTYISGRGTLALYDKLTDNSSNLWVQATASASTPKDGNCMPLQGGLDASVGATATNGITNVDAGVTFHPCIKQDMAQSSKYVFGNFAYEVTMTINQGDCGGVTFRANNQAMYYFVICSTGTYRLVRYLGDSQGSISLIPGSSSATSLAINTGLAVNNTIAVEARGTHIDLYVNQTKIDSVDDSAYSSGHVGVIAKSLSDAASHPTNVVFTKARVWTLSA